MALETRYLKRQALYPAVRPVLSRHLPPAQLGADIGFLIIRRAPARRRRTGGRVRSQVGFGQHAHQCHGQQMIVVQ